jgi:hypothetical protein
MTSALARPAAASPAALGPWQVAAGTVQGRDHWLARRNSQDALEVLVTPRAIVAIVADGCGSSPHSETGARLLASLLARTIARRAATGDDPFMLASAIDEVLDALAHATFIGEPPSASWVVDHLLATVLGVIVTGERALVFRVGDGIVGVDGGLVTHVAPGNAPSYLAYRLVGSRAPAPAPAALVPVVEWDGPASALSSVVLATDGATALTGVEGGAHATLGAWLADDALFRRPHALGRRLAQLARDEQVVDWDAQVIRRRPGALEDDTTVLLLRRATEA